MYSIVYENFLCKVFTATSGDGLWVMECALLHELYVRTSRRKRASVQEPSAVLAVRAGTRCEIVQAVVCSGVLLALVVRIVFLHGGFCFISSLFELALTVFISMLSDVYVVSLNHVQ